MASKGPSISPPPSKRRRLTSSTPPKTPLAPSIPSLPLTSLPPNCLRIFTWNINGITPFLQPSITTFFSPSLSKSKTRTLSPPSSASPPLSPPCSLRACLKRWQWPQILCLQEVKISLKDIKTQSAVSLAVKAPRCRFSSPSRATAAATASSSHSESEKEKETHKKTHEPSYTAHFSLPHDKHNARSFNGKLYGVCTLIRDDLLSTSGINTETNSKQQHIRPAPWDLEGRVLILDLPPHKLAILNIYAVNGTPNPHRDPQTGAIIGTRHDRKRAFHSALRDECARYEARGWHVVVAGDMNIARAPVDGYPHLRMGDAHVRNRRDFEEKFMEEGGGGLGMVDSFRRVNGEGVRKFSYRPRGREWGAGCDRVDLILVDGRLGGKGGGGGGAVVEADILDEEGERGPSDHVPLYVTVDLGKLKLG